MMAGHLACHPLAGNGLRASWGHGAGAYTDHGGLKLPHGQRSLRNGSTASSTSSTHEQGVPSTMPELHAAVFAGESGRGVGAAWGACLTDGYSPRQGTLKQARGGAHSTHGTPARPWRGVGAPEGEHAACQSPHVSPFVPIHKIGGAQYQVLTHSHMGAHRPLRTCCTSTIAPGAI